MQNGLTALTEWWSKGESNSRSDQQLYAQPWLIPVMIWPNQLILCHFITEMLLCNDAGYRLQDSPLQGRDSGEKPDLRMTQTHRYTTLMLIALGAIP